MGDSKNRRQHGFESLGNILQETLKPYRSEFSDRLEQVIAKWPQIAGDTMAAHCTPFAVKEKKLFVKVDNASWLHHLQFFKNDLVAKVNVAMQTELVTDIYFKVKE